MQKLFSVLFTLFLLASCGQPKTATLIRKSADGKTIVTITGKKEAMGPFNTVMSVKSGDIPEGSLTFEIYADNLSEENIRFDWSDSQHAVITFTQRDNEKRIFKLTISNTNVLLAPVL